MFYQTSPGRILEEGELVPCSEGAAVVEEPLILTHTPQVVVLAPAIPLEAGQHQAGPTEEQARVADEVFNQPQEANLVAGLIGMHAGILILHDVVRDTLYIAPDEEENRRRSGLPEPTPDL